MGRFVLHGSPHSLPTYKVALMLRLSGQPFSFRYVSFQRNLHKTPEFRALSRWGQVPVLTDNGRVHLQSMAIVEHLAETLGFFQGEGMEARQAVREWLCWDSDALFPPVWGCYGAELDRRGLLPLNIDPVIAAHNLRRAEAALSILDDHLADGGWLCGDGMRGGGPTIADLFCHGDVAFADLCGFDLGRWRNVTLWAAKVRALPDYRAPFDLLAMRDLDVEPGVEPLAGAAANAPARPEAALTPWNGTVKQPEAPRPLPQPNWSDP